MKFLIDTHLHLYPCHDVVTALETLTSNLSLVGDQEACKAGFVLDRQDCHFFEDALQGKYNFPEREFTLQPVFKGDFLAVKNRMGTSYLWGGFQTVTAENLEVASVFLKERPPENQPFLKTIDWILNKGGIPVIPWGLGKWLFERGKILEQVLKTYTPEQIVFSDSALRPCFWPSTFLHRARKNGFKILCGSDPLPLSGEEKVFGTYATYWNISDKTEVLTHFFKRLLFMPHNESRSVRKISPTFRQIRYRVLKKTSAEK